MKDPILQTFDFKIDKKSRDIKLFKSEIVGIGGIDGIGKSRLLKCLAGLSHEALELKDIQLESRSIAKLSYVNRIKKGLRYIPTKPVWVPEFSIEKNLKLYGIKLKDSDRNRLRQALKIWGFEDIKLNKRAAWISPSLRYLIFSYGLIEFTELKAILVDEAPSQLNKKERELFYELLRAARNHGAAILCSLTNDALSIPKLDRLLWMDSDSIEQKQIEKGEPTRSIKVYAAKSSLSQTLDYPPKRKLSSRVKASLEIGNSVFTDLRQSEILGIFDIRQKRTLNIHTELLKCLKKQNQIFYYVSGKIRSRGLFPSLTLSRNLSLPYLLSKKLVWISKEEQKLWKHYSEVLRLRNERSHELLNKKKVLLARFLPLKPDILFLDDYMRGVPLEQRMELYRTARFVTEAGISLIWKTREPEELVGICDRILVVGDTDSQLIETEKLELVQLMEEAEKISERKNA